MDETLPKINTSTTNDFQKATIENINSVTSQQNVTDMQATDAWQQRRNSQKGSNDTQHYDSETVRTLLKMMKKAGYSDCRKQKKLMKVRYE